MKPWPWLLCLPLVACSGGKSTPCDGACVAEAADSGQDAGLDAGEDAGADAGIDGGPDAGTDAGADGGALDAGPVDAGCRAPDGGNPPNLLPNPGFECGDPPVDWVPSASGSLASETSNPHSGTRAALLVSDDGGVPVSLFPLAQTASSGLRLWCASAWVRGVPAAGDARISLWTMAPGGLVEHNSSAPLTAGYSLMSVSATTQALDDRVTLRLWMVSPAKGAAMVVDDAELWASADGGCASH